MGNTEGDGTGVTPETTPPADGEKPNDKPETGDPKPSTDDQGKGSKEAVLADLAKERDRRKAAEKAASEAATALQQIRDALTGEKQTAEQTAEQAKAEADTAKREALRYKVALEAGLPADLVPRLLGDTEDEMKEDAKRLATLVKDAGKAKRSDARTDDNGTSATKKDPNTVLRAFVSGA